MSEEKTLVGQRAINMLVDALNEEMLFNGLDLEKLESRLKTIEKQIKTIRKTVRSYRKIQEQTTVLKD
jgi:predicted ATP-grasp superfamily ATP-dependent carboligase